MIKKNGYKFARLYTSRKYNENAQFLYKKVLDLEEQYFQEGQEFQHYVVFTKSLCNKPAPSFADGNLKVQQAEKEDDIAINEFKKYVASNICLLKQKDMNKFEKILNTYFIYDFKAFERKTRNKMINYFNSKNYWVYTLQNEDEILAYAIFYYAKNCNYFLLDYFATNSKYRSIGIGEIFFECISNAKENIVVELEPFDWQDSNDIDTRRAKFYKKCGFYFPKIDCWLHANLYELCVKTKEQKNKNQLIPEIYEMYTNLYRKGELTLK